MRNKLFVLSKPSKYTIKYQDWYTNKKVSNFGLSRFYSHITTIAKGGIGGQIKMSGSNFFVFCLFCIYEHHLKPFTGDVVSNHLPLVERCIWGPFGPR